MAKPKPDPVAWAKAQARSIGGRACDTCANPDAVAAIKAWIPLWRDGSISIGFPQAHAFLVENCGYRLSESALRACVGKHHGYRPRRA